MSVQVPLIRDGLNYWRVYAHIYTSIHTRIYKTVLDLLVMTLMPATRRNVRYTLVIVFHVRQRETGEAANGNTESKHFYNYNVGGISELSLKFK